MVEKIHKPGVNKGDVLIYALSTCIWCRKTRKLLDEIGVEYTVIEVDLIDDVKDKDAIHKEVEKWNPDCSYPTIVINKKECITGFDEEKIRRVLA